MGSEECKVQSAEFVNLVLRLKFGGLPYPRIGFRWFHLVGFGWIWLLLGKGEVKSAIPLIG
jgi:hypothetical protein